ncbi:MAG: NAD(P)/FAD-dependent oxidoreductase [Pseudomonadaceae bacterium]|nr:NAD(P)/FAD-dependent oxidoreductase [Pseudomonadaceae bacterium]
MSSQSVSSAKTSEQTDIVILGAGMAGLCLARQLQLSDAVRRRGMSITLVEHRRFPMAEAAHKVGESTVEIASHYLAEDLGLAEHLASHQLPKFGLRLFLRGQSPINDDLARYDEVGSSRVLPIPTYQIDRGRLENHLARLVTDAGATIFDGTTIRSLDLGTKSHTVVVRSADGNERTLNARYVVDASGRRAWIRGSQALAKPARHDNHAIWFRLDRRLKVDELSSDANWHARCPGGERWLSTNHFTGPGYWLWLIPLASGATSVGLVFDPRRFSATGLNRFSAFLAWLGREHPLLAEQMAGAHVLDEHLLKNYAVGASQVFSEDGWMSVGDAGVFTDPLYSPGGDFIALANGYVTAMINNDAEPDLVRDYQGYFLSFFTSTLSLYRGQYGGFGDRDFMVAKTLWDYAYYWSVLSKLFFSGAYVDVGFMQAQQPMLLRAAALNSGMQRSFRQLAQQERQVGGTGQFFDHHAVDCFHSLKQDLLDGVPSETARCMSANVDRLAFLRNALQSQLADPQPLASTDFNALFMAA